MLLFHFHIFPLPPYGEQKWKKTAELILSLKWSMRNIFTILSVWRDSLRISMEKKLLCTLTFLLHACFTREQQSAAMEWSALHSWDDCRDKQGGSFINMKRIMCHSLHLSQTFPLQPHKWMPKTQQHWDFYPQNSRSATTALSQLQPHDRWLEVCLGLFNVTVMRLKNNSNRDTFTHISQ